GFATDAVIEVENPLRAEESLLRPHLLPGLLRSVAFNAAHGLPDVALFERGSVFASPKAGDTLPEERMHLAAVRAGRSRRAPHEPDRDLAPNDDVAVGPAGGEEARRPPPSPWSKRWPRSCGSPTGDSKPRPHRGSIRSAPPRLSSTARARDTSV